MVMEFLFPNIRKAAGQKTPTKIEIFPTWAQQRGLSSGSGRTSLSWIKFSILIRSGHLAKA